MRKVESVPLAPQRRNQQRLDTVSSKQSSGWCTLALKHKSAGQQTFVSRDRYVGFMEHNRTIVRQRHAFALVRALRLAGHCDVS